jgi:hypothetical protein
MSRTKTKDIKEVENLSEEEQKKIKGGIMKNQHSTLTSELNSGQDADDFWRPSPTGKE